MLEVSYVTTLFENPVSPGQAVFGELALGSVQNSPRRFWVGYFLPAALHLRPLLRMRLQEYFTADAGPGPTVHEA